MQSWHNLVNGSTNPIDLVRNVKTSKTLCNTIFQNAGFTRRPTLRCRAACKHGKNLLPGASRGLFGSRDRETRVERRARSWQQFVHGFRQQQSKTIMKKILLLAALLVGSVSVASAADHQVRVSDFRFNPKNVNAVAGDTITWKWQNGMHTTTSTNIPAGATPWNASIDSTHTQFRIRLTVAGTYNYQCNFHFPRE